MLSFSIIQNDQATRARVGSLRMTRAEIATPAFMPVGSLGNVRGVDADELRKLGYGLMLNNAYHLYLRPGHKLIADMGGLHGFTTWPGAILTDSGGFQVFSLAKFCKVTDAVRRFNHTSTARHILSVRKPPSRFKKRWARTLSWRSTTVSPSHRHLTRWKMPPGRTVHWARRCLDARQRDDQVLFGIVQGGLNPELRVKVARDLVSLGFEGYAIGGLSVGEGKSEMYGMLDVTVPELPAATPGI